MSLTGHSDTILGSRLDPITTEKDWLIFAVRGLSHIAVGRAQGKEIWEEIWKPEWWDTECSEKWKNPTTGKKDSKTSLIKRCISLEKKLREIGKFPHELEQEFQLWKDRKLEKLFEVIKCACIEAQCTKTYFLVKELDRSIKEKKGKVDIIDFDFEHTYQMVLMTNKIIKSLKEMFSSQNHQTTLNEPTLISSTSSSKRGLDEEEDCTGLSQLAAKRPRLTPATQVSTLPSTSSSSASCRYSPSLLPLTVETTQSFKNKTHVPEKQQTTHTSSGIELERTPSPCVARQADQLDHEDSGISPLSAYEAGIFPSITNLVMSSEVSRQDPHQDHDETVKRDTNVNSDLPITDEELKQLLRKNLGSPTSTPTDNSIDNTANDSSINTTNVDQALHPKKDISGSSYESKSNLSTPLDEQDFSFDLSPEAMTEVRAFARSFVKEILQE